MVKFSNDNKAVELLKEITYADIYLEATNKLLEKYPNEREDILSYFPKSLH